ncbi:diacylglycerol kinase family enzyme [Streptomyces sp. 1114.5]|uniref:diacylglycerol/lipid kinase family protein n=1 Tax=Streptomyces sp. 1114.5 TaxID=1938830 RepID=UPI000EAFD7F2|nr:diacylglycerol kinase family protein [Streptomyces sp. 1114.5]RKT09618.1 diacylglycerol kinase family enzyme [Streptomyces sp. 1114.5]
MSSERSLTARVLARCALLAAVGAVVALLFAVGSGSLVVIVAGFLELVVWAAGLWWFVAYRGLVRVLGAFLAVAAPVGVLVLFVYRDLWLTALLLFLLWGAALVLAREALRRAHAQRAQRPQQVPRPRRPVLIMNPKSGGGKVGRFGLVERAERLGARVVLLDPAVHADVAALAREAVADGADLLGVAGGDGTQALVAAVAAEHGLPFLVICAGTRNHFAMDLGLDRSDPARCLDALTDGEELRVDLGEVAGRAFVNTVSFGVYADIVQRPEYRDDKAGTMLNLLPDLLVGEGVRRVDARIDGRVDDPAPASLSGQQALLVSNNPYASPAELDGGGRRSRLDGGVLGVLGIRVESATQAADLAVRGSQSTGLTVLTARRVEVTSDHPQRDQDEIPVAVDGEALQMPTPVVCTLRPGALRVLVPRDRPGVGAPAIPRMDWRLLAALAFNRGERDSGEHGSRGRDSGGQAHD